MAQSDDTSGIFRHENPCIVYSLRSPDIYASSTFPAVSFFLNIRYISSLSAPSFFFLLEYFLLVIPGGPPYRR